MRRRLRACNSIGIGPAAVLLLLLLGAGCGDATGGGPSGGDTVGDVVFVGDTVAGADTVVTDADAASAADADPDTSPAADSAQLDTMVVDTTVADTTVVDTTVVDTTVADTVVADTSPASDTAVADTTAPTCTGPPASHTRHVVLSYPYNADSTKADAWKVMPLASDGTLGAATPFTMGRAFEGVVAFSPDGTLGFVAQEAGKLGVFTLAPDGQPAVIAAALNPGVYLDDVVVAGDTLLLVNPNWAESGGGIYAASYDCAGNVGPAQLLYPAKNAAVVATHGGDHLVVARAAGDTTFGHLHRLRPSGGGWARVAGADLFGHDEAVLTALAVTGDGRFALVGQNSEWADFDNAVGVAALGADAVTAAAAVPLYDPVALVVSPYDDAVLAVSGYGDAVHVLAYTPAGVAPFVDQGAPTYVTSAPALPSNAVLVGGAHPDLVLLVENQAVRRFRFDGGGVVTDLGRTAVGDGVEHIPGAIGVQP